MHAIRPELRRDHPRRALEVLVLAVVLAMLVVLLAVVTAPARADPGQTPDPTGPDQEQAELLLQQAVTNGTATGTYVGPFGNERWVGVFGTHAAAGYGYPYPAAPDCNEGSLGAGCVGDSRGFLQGQCTSWVAYRLAMRNGLSFSNWYAGRHWGNASDWGKVAKGIGHKPDKYPGHRRDRLVQARPRLLRRGRLQRRHHPDLGDEHRRPQRLPLHHRQPRHERLPRQVHPPRRRRSGRHHSADRTDRRTSRPPTAAAASSAGAPRATPGGSRATACSATGCRSGASAGRPTATATRWPGRRPPTRWWPTTRPGTRRARAG